MTVILFSDAMPGMAGPPVTGIEAARAAALEPGYPVWIRAGHEFCVRVEQPTDLPMAVAQAEKRSGGPVLVQKAVAGDTYRLVGFKIGRAFHPVEILRIDFPDSVYRVPLAISVPCGLGGGPYGRILEAARPAGVALPPGYHYVEMEFVLAEEMLVLTHVSSSDAPDTATAKVLYQAYGLALTSDARLVAAKYPPQSVPTRELGAAWHWLKPDTGVVVEIEGLEAARAEPGVCEFLLDVQPGDTLGHVVDLASRDRVGHVLATGPTAAAAQSAAQRALGHLHIRTRNMI